MKEQTKNRIERFDIVKGFAMICIIAGHFGDGVVCRFVFTFHVPVFFLISGFFFKNDYEKNKRKICQLLKVYGFTTAMTAILDAIKCLLTTWKQTGFPNSIAAGKKVLYWLLAGLYGSGSKSNLLWLQLPVIGAIWFLLAEIWVILFAGFLMEKTKSSKRRIWIITAAVTAFFFFGFFSAKLTWLPFSVQAGCVSLSFFLIGYAVRKYRFSNNVNNIPAILSCLIIWGIAITFSIQHDYMSIVRCAFPDLVLNFAGAISATIVLLQLARIMVEQSWLPSLRLGLEEIGSNTLIFLSFHLIELNVFPWEVINRLHISQPVETLCIFSLKILWCFFGIYLVKKNRILQNVFYGRKI